MSNIFLSFQYTGIPKEKLDNIVVVQHGLEELGHRVFCSLDYSKMFDDKKLSIQQRYDFCKIFIKEYDLFFALVQENKPSKGMNIESKEAIRLKKPFVLGIKQDASYSFFEEAAQEIYRFDCIHEVLKNFKN